MKWEHQKLTIEENDQFEDIADTIIRYAHSLWGSDGMTVENFGENKDLSLLITKDEDYNPAEDEEYSDLVTICTSRDGQALDDTCDVYVTDGELFRELDRIYNEREMELL